MMLPPVSGTSSWKRRQTVEGGPEEARGESPGPVAESTVESAVVKGGLSAAETTGDDDLSRLSSSSDSSALADLQYNIGELYLNEWVYPRREAMCGEDA